MGKILISIFSLSLILGLCIFSVLLLVEKKYLKKIVIEEISKKTDKNISFDEDIKLSFFPFNRVFSTFFVFFRLPIFSSFLDTLFLVLFIPITRLSSFILFSRISHKRHTRELIISLRSNSVYP